MIGWTNSSTIYYQDLLSNFQWTWYMFQYFQHLWSYFQKCPILLKWCTNCNGMGLITITDYIMLIFHFSFPCRWGFIWRCYCWYRYWHHSGFHGHCCTHIPGFVLQQTWNTSQGNERYHDFFHINSRPTQRWHTLPRWKNFRYINRLAGI